MEQLINLAIFLILIIIGYFGGRRAEARHYKSIAAREKALITLPVLTTDKNAFDAQEVESVQLVYGGVVIALDYFKSFLAGLRNFVGGEISSYETLVDRARREAVLRMKEMAKAENADLIANFRIETTSINKADQNSSGCVEAMAYGTAVTLKKREIYS